jgi:hypothetical protein
MALSGVTGHDSPDAARDEAQRIVDALRDHFESFNSWEQSFIANIDWNLELSDTWAPTPKQLFKLRDLNEKC